ncbi:MULTISPECIES: PepSY domain-containing protein [unclassified Pseudomonas]|uniref:PepSY domain-containing protein n=1 Tax=unclassified Pseudomonas TaxID=196821 RepID=UPI000C88C5AD|nr:MULTISPECIES: PepSY domain-containing protein [unclassified Pseudomonas]PMX26017.1 nitric oxide synthase [Pseudomonas sp. GW460-12]PMX33145.1 nitric oxide synthase [Pseudomonas sp. MPR-R2A4]PMX40891.1 nitric oxide synthase [Pseudomonas sp. MPR-R2A7]PMX53383.1 nitric oxide synthase [Pseudomonas sp. MPR-R2A6]PMX92161.1 nitric oxide synthase [Pseudomonas sp. MPR-R2A3]
MLRQFHSLPGLIAALLVMIMAISGAVLSVNPALERLHSTSIEAGQLNVGQLAGRIAQHFPGVEQIQRTASGTLIIYYTQDGQAAAQTVDPLTGEGLGPYEPSAVSRWVKDLHRSLFMGTAGHGVAGIGAFFMLILCVSGALLLARRLGGLRNLLRPLRGTFSQRWHAEVGRLAVLGLLLSALTGLYLCATTFGLVADGSQSEPAFPTAISAGVAQPVANLQALQATDLNDLRELVYPSPGHPQDVFSLRTAQGDGYVDPVSGALVSYQAHDSLHDLYQLIYQLHTGEGLWWLGLFLGLCALSVPLMSVTGMLLWWRRRKAGPRIRHNSPAHAADSVILVGSENNTTWGFASTLHDALHQAGHRVHSAAMNEWTGDYRSAQRVLILTATHGDGDAPASATQFLKRLEQCAIKPGLPFAVLGFGDRQFAQFCQYAHVVQAAMEQAGGVALLPLESINRQSSQEFMRWGLDLGEVLGQALKLVHNPERPRTHQLVLAECTVYGEQVQAPTHVLRFKAPGGLPRFQAGDLVGIYPPGSPLPRFYSLASSRDDGVLEICVRKHEGGLCSGFLHGLAIGASIEAFIQPNPQFRPASGAHPVILIGAGTGIGPLAGFIRNNKARHPMHLYWGGRNPASDFLYEPELNRYLADHRLTTLRAAFSQVQDRSYVQDRLINDALALRRLIEKGAQVLVCGSREMAKGVMQALDEVLVPLNLSVQALKAQGRYREDVY